MGFQCSKGGCSIFPTTANPAELDIKGFYSNKSGGLRKKAGTDDQVQALIESEVSSKEFRNNWARLIQKIYPPRTQTGLKLQPRRKKLILTTKPALVIRMDIVC